MTGDNGKELTISTRMIVNKGNTDEVLLGQEVMRPAACGLETFEDVMWFRPYVHLGNYHGAFIPLLQTRYTILVGSGNEVSAHAKRFDPTTDMLTLHHTTTAEYPHQPNQDNERVGIADFKGHEEPFPQTSRVASAGAKNREVEPVSKPPKVLSMAAS